MSVSAAEPVEVSLPANGVVMCATLLAATIGQSNNTWKVNELTMDTLNGHRDYVRVYCNCVPVSDPIMMLSFPVSLLFVYQHLMKRTMSTNLSNNICQKLQYSLITNLFPSHGSHYCGDTLVMLIELWNDCRN